MKFTTAAFAAAAATVVAATPAGVTNAEKINTNEVFQIMTLRTGTPLQYGKVTASKNGFQVNNPSQGASCGPDSTDDFAQFQLNKKGELSLFTPNPPQGAFVDRSGMGQGIIQYTTGVQGIPRNAERSGFALDENNYLTFDGSGFQACPSSDNTGYRIWLGATTDPAGYKDCIPFTAQALKVEKPVKCTYKAV